MTIEEVTRLALSGIRLQDYDKGTISDCVYKAIRNMQRITKCSKGDFAFTVPQSLTDTTYETILNSKEITVYVSENHGFQKNDRVYATVTNVYPYSSHGVYSRVDSSLNGDAEWIITDVGYDWVSFSVLQVFDGTYTQSTGLAGISLQLQGEQTNRPIQCFFNRSPKNNNADYFHVAPIMIDELYDVYTDGSLNRYNLLDRASMEVLKNEYTFTYSSVASMNGAIDYDGEHVSLITPFDQRGRSFRVVMRYAIPYIQDYNIAKTSTSSIPDAMLMTIPEIFMDALILGVKVEVYKHMEEFTGMLGKYQRQIDRFEMDWMKETLEVKSSVNRWISKETVSAVRPDSLLGGC